MPTPHRDALFGKPIQDRAPSGCPVATGSVTPDPYHDPFAPFRKTQPKDPEPQEPEILDIESLSRTLDILLEALGSSGEALKDIDGQCTIDTLMFSMAMVVYNPIQGNYAVHAITRTGQDNVGSQGALLGTYRTEQEAGKRAQDFGEAFVRIVYESAALQNLVAIFAAPQK